MGDARCKHCGEPVVAWRGPNGTWTFEQWRHDPSGDLTCRLFATPEEARRG